MKIAVIGSGISGLGAAWLLSRKHEVTLFEKDARLGGHSNTVEVAGTLIDTGFIVFNAPNYPNLVGLFAALNVATENSNMSFSASVGGGALEYAGTNLNTVFAQRKNLLNPRFLRMLADILRFNKKAAALLHTERDITLGAYLDEMRMGQWFRTRYLLPMAAAIWSCPMETMLRYPARSFLRFFENHGLLTVANQPQWQTVTGGSRSYVQKIEAALGAGVRKNTAIARITRDVDHVTLVDANGNHEVFDHVVMATHGDQILPMLADVDGNEKRILGNFTTQENRAVLHSDPRLMPKNKRVWSSWNYFASNGEKSGGVLTTTSDQAGAQPLAALERQTQDPVSLTYWMNKLQNLPPEKDYFVTLNPQMEPEQVHYACVYSHPVFDANSLISQLQLPRIQGERRTWFCGAWTRYGFHEDGLLSAVNVAEKLGVKTPW